MTAAALVVDVSAVTKIYRRGRVEVPVLREVSLALASGETVAVMGPSGSGKTTLLNLIAGLDRPTAGRINVAGVEPATLPREAATTFRRRTIGFVFQFFNLLPTMTARENVALPLLCEGLGRREIDRRVGEVLTAVGLSARAEHRPDEMSGGEQQRVGVARALVMRPRLQLADEPTGNLDRASRHDVLTLLRRAVRETGLAIVMATHSAEAARAMDRAVEIRDGTLGRADETDAA